MLSHDEAKQMKPRWREANQTPLAQAAKWLLDKTDWRMGDDEGLYPITLIEWATEEHPEIIPDNINPDDLAYWLTVAENREDVEATLDILGCGEVAESEDDDCQSGMTEHLKETDDPLDGAAMLLDNYLYGLT